MEKCKVHKLPLYMVFIDYSKAFDCVSHNEMWETMKRMGFPKHLIDLTCRLYEDQESAVRTSSGDSEWFGIGRGLRQGCILSPSFFNVYSEDIMREALEDFEGGVKFGGVKITNLRYADDTTLICSSRQELMDLLRRVKEASEKKGLLLNTKKTKIMFLDKEDTGADFSLDGQTIDVVQQFEYLGSLINTKSDSSTEIKRRLAIARKTLQDMSSIWKSKGLSMILKVRFLKATIFSIASYGSESWAMTKNDRKRVDAFEMWSYRRLLGVSWRDKKSNNWVLDKIGTGLTLRRDINSRKLRYFGHISRRDTSVEKLIMQSAVEGSRGRGRPITSWTDDIKRITGLSVTEATYITCIKHNWKASSCESHSSTVRCYLTQRERERYHLIIFLWQTPGEICLLMCNSYDLNTVTFIKGR